MIYTHIHTHTHCRPIQKARQLLKMKKQATKAAKGVSKGQQALTDINYPLVQQYAKVLIGYTPVLRSTHMSARRRTRQVIGSFVTFKVFYVYIYR